jgi:DNA mismatch endonuclease, patch repair protein
MPGGKDLERRGKPTYLRDGRAPIPRSEKTSYTMSRIRAKNTKPELLLRRALRRAGLRDYTLHSRRLPGRPDVAFPADHLAVFVHGCYWHRCPRCRKPLPKSHTEFWRAKFRANVRRDRQKATALQSAGWRVLTLWECEVKQSAETCVERIRAARGR